MATRAEIGRTLREGVRQTGLTQEQFAAQVGVDWYSLRKWLCGQHAPYPHNAAKLAAALGIEVERLTCTEERQGEGGGKAGRTAGKTAGGTARQKAPRTMENALRNARPELATMEKPCRRGEARGYGVWCRYHGRRCEGAAGQRACAAYAVETVEAAWQGLAESVAMM